jgi:hypothetical protein
VQEHHENSRISAAVAARNTVGARHGSLTEIRIERYQGPPFRGAGSEQRGVGRTRELLGLGGRDIVSGFHQQPLTAGPEIGVELELHDVRAQPWARFCAIVRIISGTTLSETLDDE